MKYQLQYNVCAIVIYSLVLITHLMQKNTKEKHNQMFTILVSDGLLGAAVNIFNTVGNMNPSLFNLTVLKFLDYVYFITLNLMFFIYALYVIMIRNNSITRISIGLKLLLYLPTLITVGLIISNPFIQGIFYYKNGVYTRGNLQALMFLVNQYYFFFGVVQVLKEKRYVRKQLKMAFCMFLVVGDAAAVVQLFYPELLLQHFAISVSTLILLLNVQKTNEYLDPEKRIFNKNAFERIFNLNLHVKNMELMLLIVEDLNYLIRTLGREMEKAIVYEISAYLEEITDGNVYYIGKNSFVILNEKNKKEFTENILREIREKFSQEWKIRKGEQSIIINYKMMVIRTPEEIHSLEAFYFCYSNFEMMSPDENHMIELRQIDFAKVDRKTKVEELIKKAIKDDLFDVFYQPIYSIEEDRIVSAEALVRLIDPKYGFVSPAEFIPISEKNGTIITVGKIVLEKIFRFISQNDLRSLGIQYIEINLSVVQCMQSDIADCIFSLMNKYQIDKNMVNFEITETAAADSPKVLMRNIDRIAKEGIAFSLDDFGTGYSNINSLMSMPLKIIKFDKSLVDMASHHEHGRSVVDSSVAMVKKMGMEIVAEGIEQESQISIMKDMGVDFLQGYYFSRPLPEERFIEYLQKSQPKLIKKETIGKG